VDIQGTPAVFLGYNYIYLISSPAFYLMKMILHNILIKIAVIALALILVILGAVFIWFNEFKIYEFAGNVTRVEGDSVFVSGIFLEDGKPLTDSPTPSEIEISVGPETKMERTGLKIPVTADMFNPDDLEKVVLETDLATVKHDSTQHTVGMEGTIKRGLFGAGFTGLVLNFKVPIFSY
jgi:hypothetical protein